MCAYITQDAKQYFECKLGCMAACHFFTHEINIHHRIKFHSQITPSCFVSVKAEETLTPELQQPLCSVSYLHVTDGHFRLKYCLILTFSISH